MRDKRELVMFKKNWIGVSGLISFVIVISLGIVGGCNDGGGEGAPCAAIKEECPCIYSQVPPTTLCWPAPPPESIIPQYTNVATECSLNQTLSFPPPVLSRLVISISGTMPSCQIDMSDTLPVVCGEANTQRILLTQGETEACKCRLEQYVKELIELGITVTDIEGDPLAPADISCTAG